MKLSLYLSIEQELEAAIAESFPDEILPVPVIPDNNSPPLAIVDELTKMSYLLKFKPGNYYAHLKPDNRYN